MCVISMQKETLSEWRKAVLCLSQRIITRACAAVGPGEHGIPRRPSCLHSTLNIYRPGRLTGAVAARPDRSRTWCRPGERRQRKSLGTVTWACTGTCMGAHRLVMQRERTGKKYANRLKWVLGKNPGNPNTNVQMALFCGSAEFAFPSKRKITGKSI